MKKVLIFGNSGAGKSTLAKWLCDREGLAHLDLDTLAWQPGEPPRRQALEVSARIIGEFTARHGGWVMEGCYADLMEVVAAQATDMIFLDLPVEQCVANARARPWEPHKYPSKAEQDANLAMLIAWIASYPSRDDVCSRAAHRALFEGFSGHRELYRSTPRLSG